MHECVGVFPGRDVTLGEHIMCIYVFKIHSSLCVLHVQHVTHIQTIQESKLYIHIYVH